MAGKFDTSMLSRIDGRIVKIELHHDYTGAYAYRVHLVIDVDATDELQVYSKLQGVLSIAKERRVEDD